MHGVVLLLSLKAVDGSSRNSGASIPIYVEGAKFDLDATEIDSFTWVPKARGQPKIEGEGRQREWGSWLGVAISDPTSCGVWGAL